MKIQHHQHASTVALPNLSTLLCGGKGTVAFLHGLNSPHKICKTILKMNAIMSWCNVRYDMTFFSIFIHSNHSCVIKHSDFYYIEGKAVVEEVKASKGFL